MVSQSGFYAAITVAYALAAVVFTLWLRRVPARLRVYGWGIVLVCVFAILSSIAALFNFGVVAPLGANPIPIPTFVEFGISYPILGVLAVVVAGASRRRLWQAVGCVEGIVIGNAAAQAAPAPLSFVLFLGMLAFFGGLVWLLLRPIWQTAQQQSADRRLLFWKLRNLLVFGVTMLIVAGLLVPGVLAIFNDFVSTVASSYVGFLIRIGFGFFVFGNIDAFERVGTDSDRQSTTTAADAA